MVMVRIDGRWKAVREVLDQLLAEHLVEDPEGSVTALEVLERFKRELEPWHRVSPHSVGHALRRTGKVTGVVCEQRKPHRGSRIYLGVRLEAQP